MEYSNAILSQTRLPGQQHDYKRCFQASNSHFTCLDTSSNLDQYDNHHKCPQTYQQWVSSCDVGIRRYQMDNREQQKQDQKLYTKEQLKNYNNAKNKEALSITPPKNLNFAF